MYLGVCKEWIGAESESETPVSIWLSLWMALPAPSNTLAGYLFSYFRWLPRKIHVHFYIGHLIVKFKVKISVFFP